MKKWISILNPRRWSEKDFVIAALAANWVFLIIVLAVNHIRDKRFSQENAKRFQSIIERLDETLETQSRRLQRQKQKEEL